MKLLLLIISSIFFCCEESNNCDILRKIVEDKRVEQFLHLELQDRNKLYLVENENFKCNIRISESLEIITVSKNKTTSFLNYIELISYEKVTESSLVITLKYPIEGAIFKVDFNLKTREIKDIEIIEF